jgi:hypothetical protein
MIQSADDANYTMYPTADYTYQISYDYPDAGNRLIGSIGNAKCPDIVIPGTPGTPGDPDNLLNFNPANPAAESVAFYQASYGVVALADLMKPTMTPITKIRIGGYTLGNVTVPNLRINMELHPWGSGTFYTGPRVGSTFQLYINGVAGTAVPQGGSSGIYTAPYKWETPSGFSFSAHDPTKWYWFYMYPDASISGMNTTNTIGIGWPTPRYVRYLFWTLSDGIIRGHQEQSGHDPAFSTDFGGPSAGDSGTPPTTIPACGGLPETEDADPLLMIASDCNMAKRIGMVEQTVTNMPIHVKNFTSMNEYLYNKLYITARPRFNFDYPEVTAPGTMPKAGDICCHISKKAQIGRARTGVQTGVISSVNYTFGQDADSILGLRKLAISTSGILRGSY